MSTSRPIIRTALSVPYDNTTSGLTSADVQAALDEISAAAVTQLTDLTDVTAKTGTGTLVVMQGSPTLLTPTIASFTNAGHDHSTAAGGGALAATAVTDHVGAIDHNALLNFASNEHFTEASIGITAAQVTSLTFADARIAASNVTQYEASLSIGIGQLTGGTAAQVLVGNFTQSPALMFMSDTLFITQTVAGTGAYVIGNGAGSAQWTVTAGGATEFGTTTADNLELLRDSVTGLTLTTAAVVQANVGLEVSDLTVNRVVYTAANGRLTDTSNFMFDGTTVTISSTGDLPLRVTSTDPTCAIAINDNTTTANTLYVAAIGDAMHLRTLGTSRITIQSDGDLDMPGRLGVGGAHSDVYMLFVQDSGATGMTELARFQQDDELPWGPTLANSTASTLWTFYPRNSGVFEFYKRGGGNVLIYTVTAAGDRVTFTDELQAASMGVGAAPTGVSGQLTVNNIVFNDAGLVGAPSYTFTSDPDTGMWRVNSDQLGLSVGGKLVLHLTSTTWRPSLTNDIDLGTSTLAFGTEYVRRVRADTGQSFIIQRDDGTAWMTLASGGSATISRATVFNDDIGLFLGTGSDVRVEWDTVETNDALKISTGVGSANASGNIIIGSGITGTNLAYNTSANPRLYIASTTTPISNFFSVHHDATNVRFIAGAGSFQFSNVLLAPNGTSGAPAYTFASDPDTGMYGNGAGILQFTVNAFPHIDMLNAGATVTTTLISADAGALGHQLVFSHTGGSPLAADVIARLRFEGQDSAFNPEEYARIDVIASTVTSTSEVGEIKMQVNDGGSLVDILRASPDSLLSRDGGTEYNVTRGTAKAWINFNGNGGITINDSENITSVTDLGVGLFTINIANDFTNASYCFTGAARDSGTTCIIVGRNTIAPLAGALSIATLTNGDVSIDPEQACLSFYGDLA